MSTMPKVSDLSAASPDMDENEMQALVDSIRQVGQQVPILVYHGEVIDGRKRLAACERLGIEPKVQELEDDADPATYAIALNVVRTHYSTSQRAMFASRVATLRKGDVAVQRRVDGGVAIDTPQPAEEAAKAFGVSRVQVFRAKRVRREATPEVVDAVERGEVTINKALATLIPTPPVAVEEQPPQPPVLTLKRDTGVRSSPRRDPAAVCGRAFATVRTMADILEEVGPQAVPTPEQLADWHRAHRAYLEVASDLFARLGPQGDA